MRNSLLIIGAVALSVILWSASPYAAHSPGGKTGSPADGSNCTQCHAGSPQTISNWITTNIPSSGYVPGQTYTITLTGTHTGVSRFGFELTAEDSKSNKVGTFTITNSTETGLTNGSHAVTHTGNGLTPTNNTKTWSFEWTAPAAGTGDVKFYAALNAANGDQSAGGDVIYLTNTQVIEDVNASIEGAEANSHLKLYPNPASDVLNISYPATDDYQLKIMDIAGKELIIRQLHAGQINLKLDMGELEPGVYFVQITEGDRQIVKRIVKQ